jgi:murein DD-endopeptidase MepM/ murein hydrolase activator NlpD
MWRVRPDAATPRKGLAETAFAGQIKRKFTLFADLPPSRNPQVGPRRSAGATEDELFKDRDSDSAYRGSLAGAAGLSRAQIVAERVTPEPVRLLSFANFADRYEQWRQRASLALSGVDFAPDLSSEIGSRRWLRGVATMTGLTALALAAWPGFAPLKAAPAMRIDQSVRDEFRSQMIMPLALGADSGRHMAPTLAVMRLKGAPERPRLDLVATLGIGDSFQRMLERAGVSDGESGQVAALVARVTPLGEIQPGTQVDIALGQRLAGSAQRPLDGLSFRARFDLQLAVERVGNHLALKPHPIEVDTTPLRIRGIVGQSLYLSARAAGAPASAVQEYLRTLDGEMDLDNISAGDEFDLIVDYKRAATGETEAGQLLYAGLIHDGKPRKQLMRWGGKFYEASGVGESHEGLMRPVPGWETSGYGMRRHPILGYTRMHRGIDFHAPYGSPIYAVTDGVVEYAGPHGGHGNFVKLGHGGGLETGYAHMSRIAVEPGEHVRRGEVIGYVGSSGLATGPHLHFEVYEHGETVNPDTVTYVNRSELSATQLVAFRSTLAELQRIQPGAALAPLAPDPVASARPGREIARIGTPRPVG